GARSVGAYRVLGEVRGRHARVQTCDLAQGDAAQSAGPLAERDRVAPTRRAAEPRMGALRDPQARASHFIIPTSAWHGPDDRPRQRLVRARSEGQVRQGFQLKHAHRNTHAHICVRNPERNKATDSIINTASKQTQRKPITK
uniref:Uncharacterized protein n=1 Tax=Globisporangium ultimum (strain ATCC 200006 / CBS 805.95 / DAOM BR144) TaxID=431595 RepID=K3WS59_GLOUD